MLIRCNYINQVRCRGSPGAARPPARPAADVLQPHPAPPSPPSASNAYLASRTFFLLHFSSLSVCIPLFHPHLFFFFTFSSVLFPTSSICPPSSCSSPLPLPSCLRLLQYPLVARTRRSHMRPENMCRTCNLRHVGMVNKRALGPLHDEARAEEARRGQEQRGYDSLDIMSRSIDPW